jgi:EPS-associated MarR family transcriptional regulator|tara:strand:+ start:1862 stop:2164 length:303 start_codon:yes stop_codon:yes gene_type:complete
MNKNQEYLDILRKIKKEPENSQRNLSKNLGMSLGKLNYCLNSLKKKGIIKIKNFKNNPNKMKYAYIITPKGLSLKTKLTINFMKRKMNEYDELKKELNSN